MNSQYHEKKQKEIPIFLIAPIISVVLIFLVPISYFITFNGELAKKQDIWGQFGDYVGGTLNPMLSFVTLLVLLYTVKLQRKELDKTSKQLEISESSLAKQIEISKKQQFEVTFFQMLTLFNEITSEIEIQVPQPELEKHDNQWVQITSGWESPKDISGRKCFTEFYDKLRKNPIWLRGTSKQDQTKKISSAYGYFHGSYKDETDHYFKMLCNILKFIKNSDIEDKQFYTDLVMALLSTQELLMLFYNGLSLGSESFKPLIEEFQLFKGITAQQLVDSSHYELYASSAYGNS
ncbi:putative phage abortive infection protein [Methylovulum psychrotolerans]|uniref:Phage abortive infection protein n=1 Tax=Methylovulum psychrotolerans TaxID=1704499 RepID=A0A2S5CSW6_9GAMM|nr:putative phage abortive infection protein [Methylovulum psychrotolerans]POZ53895.1 hypothetical protein AADEFJLK_00937 [Methylovulum psychrotolerans]